MCVNNIEKIKYKEYIILLMSVMIKFYEDFPLKLIKQLENGLNIFVNKQTIKYCKLCV